MATENRCICPDPLDGRHDSLCMIHGWSPRRCTCPGLGVSPDCLLHMSAPDQDEPELTCSGQCLTGFDIGVPSSAIAHAHPDCPVHGEPRERPYEYVLGPEEVEG